MITVAFYSYKGGVGRTLTLANLGMYVSQFGATVAIADLDLEAPGLHYKLRPGQSPIPVKCRGMAGFLADISQGASPEESAEGLILDVTDDLNSRGGVPSSPRGRLLLLPAGNPTSNQYWNDVHQIDWAYLFTNGERPGVAAFAYLRERLKSEFKTDLLLVDSRTGITISGGVATTLLPDVVVAFFLNTPEHLDGSRLVVSAIVGASPMAPRVVPVLARFTAASRRRSESELHFRRRIPEPEAPPASDIWDSVVRGLPQDAAQRVDQLHVLHSEMALQRSEYLSFGPDSTDTAGEGGILLDDYLRLFAHIVPVETVRRYVEGVRTQARELILDDPDAALRTLENLAALVGDEAVFGDLFKLYNLRKDGAGMLRAAERLFRVHGKIVRSLALTRVVLNLVSKNTGVHVESPESNPELGRFVEAYGREQLIDNPELLAPIARFNADLGRIDAAASLVGEMIETVNDVSLVSKAIDDLSRGGRDSEELAISIAKSKFEACQGVPEFLTAAAKACGYREDSELAHLILLSPVFNRLRPPIMINMLSIAGRADEAASLGLEVLSDLDPSDESTIEEYFRIWNKLVSSSRGIRAELRIRNPDLLEKFESYERRHRRTRSPFTSAS